MQTQQQQYLKDNNGKNVGIFLTIKEYEMILEKLEELEDIKDYDEAKVKNEPTIPLREAIKIRKQKNG
ncbi:MAG: hypothetical protein H8D45_17015 [Bacteroidetes bacterium]|nr:hypothetical protein [Bacteroidota bacterium]MBL7103930.1 hypothetical protein [Bacteroidales bacterium]MCD4790920.1 hypothetical protein [Bacteroidales bacterium]